MIHLSITYNVQIGNFGIPGSVSVKDNDHREQSIQGCLSNKTFFLWERFFEIINISSYLIFLNFEIMGITHFERFLFYSY